MEVRPMDTVIAAADVSGSQFITEHMETVQPEEVSAQLEFV